MPQSESGRDTGRRRLLLQRLDWPVTISIVLMHVGVFAAPFVFSWSGFAVMCLLTWLAGPVGISLCYHRLLTHRSFNCPKWFEYLLTACGCLACQGSPIQWVGVHRIHHKHSDRPDDPHSPKHGFAWSHVFWCMLKDQGQLCGWAPADAARDMCRDRGMRLLNRFYLAPPIIVGLACWGGGELAAHFGMRTSGLSWLIWGTCVRSVLVYHTTWFVNSASHTWGYRNYETDDNSTNCWWVAWLSLGEWHNNHHGDQRAANHGGLRWWEIDATYTTILLFRAVGLASDVVDLRRNRAGEASNAPNSLSA